VNELVPIARLSPVPVLVAAAGEHASMRFLEFFAANIRNPHTRRAYAQAADEFLAWCASAGVPSSIGVVRPAGYRCGFELALSLAPSEQHVRSREAVRVFFPNPEAAGDSLCPNSLLAIV
jgi:hypothetical protein